MDNEFYFRDDEESRFVLSALHLQLTDEEIRGVHIWGTTHNIDKPKEAETVIYLDFDHSKNFESLQQVMKYLRDNGVPTENLAVSKDGGTYRVRRQIDPPELRRSVQLNF